jgi:geranylgeranyl pyrophosphate synthase
VPLAGEDRVKLESLQELIAPDLAAFEAEYRRLLSGELPLLTEIADHLKRGQGKRFRPTLLLIAAKNGQPNAEAVFSAACIELVHTATLIHDDFIDEAEMRVRRTR